MSFVLYTVGLAIMLGGLIYAAKLMHLTTPWIVVGSMVLLGFGLLTAVKNTRQKDPSN